MSRLDVLMPPAMTIPPRSRHVAGYDRGLPLFVWPIVAMAAMLPILIVMILLLVT